MFGLDFDLDEFAAFGEDKTSYLDEEEEDEEVSCLNYNATCFLLLVNSHPTSKLACYLNDTCNLYDI